MNNNKFRSNSNNKYRFYFSSNFWTLINCIANNSSSVGMISISTAHNVECRTLKNDCLSCHGKKWKFCGWRGYRWGNTCVECTFFSLFIFAKQLHKAAATSLGQLIAHTSFFLASNNSAWRFYGNIQHISHLYIIYNHACVIWLFVCRCHLNRITVT